MTHPHPLNQHQTPNIKPNQHNTQSTSDQTPYATNDTIKRDLDFPIPKGNRKPANLGYQLRQRDEVDHSCCFQCFQCTSMQTNLTWLPSTAATRNLPKEFRNPGGGQAAGDWIWWPKPMCTKNRTPLSPASGSKAPLTGDDGWWRDVTRRDETGRAVLRLRLRLEPASGLAVASRRGRGVSGDSRWRFSRGGIGKL
jgi:hypothetical protein